MPSVTIDEQGRLVLPRAVRDRMGLQKGRAHRLTLWESGDGVMLEPEPRTSVVATASDGMPALTIDGGEEIDNADVVAAIRRDRSSR